MSAFYNSLVEILDRTKNSDRQIICAPTMEVRFLSETIRLWGGIGPMITPDGNRWTGWQNGDPENPQSYISIPSISDPRDGNSPLYQIDLGYIDKDSYDRLKSSEEETNGRKILIGCVYLEGSNTRSPTLPGNVTRLTIRGRANFSEKRAKMADGSHKVAYRIGIKAVNINESRSRTSFPVHTYTVQKFRSQSLFGVTGDEYGQFLARLAGGITLKI